MAKLRFNRRITGTCMLVCLIVLALHSDLSAQNAPSKTLKGHKDAISSLAFSPDGKTLASGSFDTTVQLYDVRSGELKQTLKDLDKKVSAVIFSPDGKILAGGSWMLHESGSGQAGKYVGEVKLWNSETGAVTKTLTWRSAPMWALDYTPRGQKLAAGTGLVKKEDGKYYGQIIIWDAESGEITSTLTAHSAPIWSVGFSPDGQTIAAGSGLDAQSGTYEGLVWNVATGRLKFVLKGHTGRVISVVFSPANDVIATASADHTVRLWDAKTGALKQTLAKEGDVEEAQAGAAAKTPYTDRVKLESPGFFSVIKSGWTNSVAFSKDGKMLAGISGSKKIQIWETQTGKLLHSIDSPARGIYSIAFAPDGGMLATGNADGTVHLWNLASLR
jgi:WD40 repeat protein